ncbi:hypothetical protein [Parasitella parasitica]|uniref:Uncharacterized protein n=1 Tax=Parasitella parasitica TaxID=35722 RepID=A0A0B7NGZ4_9FUNG|nr:hypothetical protein [Parasitella parasitica]
MSVVDFLVIILSLALVTLLMLTVAGAFTTLSSSSFLGLSCSASNSIADDEMPAEAYASSNVSVVVDVVAMRRACCNIFHDDDCSCEAVERRAFVRAAGAPAEPIVIATTAPAVCPPAACPPAACRVVAEPVSALAPAPAISVSAVSVLSAAAGPVSPVSAVPVVAAAPASVAPVSGASTSADLAAPAADSFLVAASAFARAEAGNYLVSLLPLLAVQFVALLVMHHWLLAGFFLLAAGADGFSGHLTAVGTPVFFAVVLRCFPVSAVVLAASGISVSFGVRASCAALANTVVLVACFATLACSWAG